ncbi:hypothetical protein COK46_01820 [Bacillus thuringiensis]|uniref:hypothetical protein n=1 Tax=Bacillus thuringiensis TaxID=1428 RepID=UPI000BF9A25E|nr:hypothetical protein [Bacillus thuringiensis]PFS24376.1 hypothetical protein COK46_01820 [Bacillus thuringiensis]
MKKPFAPESNYTEVHNALFTLYTKLPDFRTDHIVMYTVLMNLYNVEYGYAFPTNAELALRLNCGINKPTQIAKVLEKYGLIRFEPRDRSKFASNNVYYVYAPITDASKFEDKYSEAITLYKERETRILKRNKKPKLDEVTIEGQNDSTNEADIISYL